MSASEYPFDLILFGCLLVVTAVHSWNVPSNGAVKRYKRFMNWSTKSVCPTEPKTCITVRETNQDDFSKNICTSEYAAEITWSINECARITIDNIVNNLDNKFEKKQEINVAFKPNCSGVDLAVGDKYCVLFDQKNFNEADKYITFDENAILAKGSCVESAKQCAMHRSATKSAIQTGEGDETTTNEDKPEDTTNEQKAARQMNKESEEKTFTSSLKGMERAVNSYAAGYAAPAPASYAAPAPASYSAPAPASYGAPASYSAPAPASYSAPAPASYAPSEYAYEAPSYSAGGYPAPSVSSYSASSYAPSYQYRRHFARKMPVFRGVNAFEDYYASSFNVSDSCPSTPTSCPVCLDNVDDKFEGICNFTSVFESKFEEVDNNFKCKVSKTIRSADSLKDEYDFIINQKCLDSCSQLDSTSGLLLFVKNSLQDKCLKFDEDVIIVPSTYMNKFDTKALMKKQQCSQ